MKPEPAAVLEPVMELSFETVISRTSSDRMSHTRQLWVRLVMMVCMTFAVLGPVTYLAVFNPSVKDSDYQVHVAIATHMVESGRIAIPHFLYHGLLIAVNFVTGADYLVIAWWISMAAYSIAGALILRYFEGFISNLISLLLLSCALMIVGPINYFTAASHNLYLGYLSPVFYANPTITLLKPLALAHFILLTRCLYSTRDEGAGWKWSAVLLIAGGLAKPSYMLCVLLASPFLFFMADTTKARTRLIWSTILPATLLLAWQYIFTFTLQGSDYHAGKVILAPLAAMRSNSEHIIPKFIASVVFPVAMVALFFDEATRDRSLITSIVFACCGMLISYLVAETGANFHAMNFVWCGEITLWILFIQCTRSLLNFKTNGWKKRIAWTCFGLHIGGGLLWYASQNVQPGGYL